MENIVKMIVKKYGGYREKEIMHHSHTIVTMSICG